MKTYPSDKTEDYYNTAQVTVIKLKQEGLR